MKETLRFGPGPRPLPFLVVCALLVFVAGVWALGSDEVGSRTGLPLRWVAGPLGIVLSLTIFACAAAAQGFKSPNLTLSPDGLAYTSLFGSRISWRWREIESVTVWHENHGLGGTPRPASGLIIRRRDGGKKRLRELDRPGEEIALLIRARLAAEASRPSGSVPSIPPGA